MVRNGYSVSIRWVVKTLQCSLPMCMPLDAEAAAINVLETTTYFQGKWSVDDYLDQFRDLIYDSGYTDPKTVVVKFRRGLDC